MIEMGIQQIDFEKQYTIDYERKKRTGAPEIIYGEGKTKEQIEAIIADMLENGQDAIFASRVDEEKAAYLQARFPKLEYDKAARVLVWRQDWNTVNPGRICVVCAGTSDVPVAMEAVWIARFLGNDVDFVCDIGVAGIHRLLARMDQINAANVIVVVAGMEGALASVVGGLTNKPVIAVPTSVGYGANFQGLSALLSMLNSCASGVSVVNIDNGFGAGFMAHTINCLARRGE